MKKKMHFFKKFSLKTKIFLFIFLVAIYAIIVFIQWNFFIRPSKNRIKNQTETTETSRFFETTGSDEENIHNSNEEKINPLETEQSIPETSGVSIKNMDTLAEPVMGSYSYLLEKSLEAYASENNIDSSEATLLEAAPSLTRDKVTEFYIETKDGFLVTLFWDPYRQTVDAQDCQYTKKEIKENVWMRVEREPMEHGVAKEKDDEFSSEKMETEASINEQSGSEPAESSDGQ